MSLVWLGLTILLVVVAVIAALLFALLLFTIATSLYARKLMFELPWMKWMTLEDVRAMGYSKFMSRFALDILHDRHYVEIREMAGLSELAREWVEKDKFNPWTAQYHEFRLIKRTGRIRRPKWYWNPLDRHVPA